MVCKAKFDEARRWAYITLCLELLGAIAVSAFGHPFLGAGMIVGAIGGYRLALWAINYADIEH